MNRGGGCFLCWREERELREERGLKGWRERRDKR